MKTLRVSATQARNNFFTLLNQVMYEDTSIIIEKTGTKRNAVLMPNETIEETAKKRFAVLDETYGIFANVPKSRFTDDRLRGKKARLYLKNVRKGNV